MDYTEEEKEAFEEEVNIFSGDYPEYVRAGSTVTVETRQTLVAATATIVSAVPTVPARRRTRR